MIICSGANDATRTAYKQYTLQKSRYCPIASYRKIRPIQNGILTDPSSSPELTAS